MSHNQLTAILDMVAQNPIPPNITPDELRAWIEAANSHTPVAENVEISRVSCGPVEGDLLIPPGGDASRLIIYYHGGGFLFGSSRTHRVTVSNLARAAGCAVWAPDYRLGPEHPAPAAHEDAFGVYLWALTQGFAPGRIALAGDSAGGNLALHVAVRAKAQGLPQPAALVLLSPWVDFAEDGASYREVTDDPFITRDMLDAFKAAYLGEVDPKSPEVTPFYADFAGLPPTLIHVGSWERLRDESVTLSERMTAAGVTVDLKIFEGMPHTWQMFAPFLDEGMQSIEAGAAFIAARQRA